MFTDADADGPAPGTDRCGTVADAGRIQAVLVEAVTCRWKGRSF